MGLTALLGAVNRGSNDIIELLVKRGARLDIKDKEGRTPLRWAEGVFLAAVGAERKPATIALLEKLRLSRPSHEGAHASPPRRCSCCALANVETQTAPRAAARPRTLGRGSGTQAAPAGAQAVVDRYCVTCHNARLQTGGLALDGLDVAQAGRRTRRRGRRSCARCGPA